MLAYSTLALFLAFFVPPSHGECYSYGFYTSSSCATLLSTSSGIANPFQTDTVGECMDQEYGTIKWSFKMTDCRTSIGGNNDGRYKNLKEYSGSGCRGTGGARADTTYKNGTCIQVDGSWRQLTCGECPSPSPSTPPGATPAAAPCFPSSAKVIMADGTPSRIDTLKEGDEIVAATQDGTLTTDTVSLLSIAKPEAKGDAYIALTTAASKTLTLTPGHHVPVGDKCCSTLKQAKYIEVGDQMWVVKDGAVTASTVTAKSSSAKAVGLHSPVLTNGGFPVVDGVVTSFDSIEKVTLAKYGLAPLLLACKATGTCENFREMFLSTDSHHYIA